MSDLLNKASLVMVPSGYKEDTVYSVVPSDGSGDLSFTRASNGTRINSAGLVEVVAWNLLEQSETFDNVVWSKEPGNTVTANTTTSPNGTTTADTLNASATNQLNIYQTYTPIAGSYTYSVYLKKNGTNLIETYIYQVGVGFIALGEINFDNGTFTASLGTGSIENVGNGWYRVSLTASLVAGAHTFGFFTTSSTGTRSTFAWGAQVNIGSTAKPYFPTTDRLNVPRLTYQNGGGGCPSLLLEKQSTNLVTYSEDFSNADWLKQQATISANATTSPDGTQNADKLIINNGVAGGYVYQLKSTSSGTVYTGSFYVKAGGVGYTKFWTNISGSYEDAVINLSTGAITNSNFAITPTAQSVGNGWYRVVYTTTSGGGQVVVYVDGGSTSTGGSYTGNGTDGIFLWGAQLEASSYPTSYIPSTSSSATRVADACYKTGISSLIGQTEGVLFVDFDFTGNYDNSGHIPLVVYDGSNEAYIFITTGGSIRLELYNGGALQCLITTSIGAIGRKKIAFAYKQNDFVGYMNGTQIGTDTSGTVGSMTTLRIGAYYTANYSINSGINQAVLFPTRLTNAELQAITTI